MATCGADGDVRLWPAISLANIHTQETVNAPRP
jgi:hypothetical protein